MKVLLVDNYDSFTYNLVQRLGELGASCEVVRNDAMSAEEILAVYRGKTSAAYRMVTTYWNMAAALVLHEAIDEKMFADVNGEHLMVYARLQPFLTEFRGLLNNPTYLDKLEQVILRMPDAQARLARFRRPAPPAKTTSKGPRRVA